MLHRLSTFQPNYTTTRKGLTVEDCVTGVQHNWLLYFYKKNGECEMVFREHVCSWSCLCLPQNGRHETGLESPLRRAPTAANTHTGLRARSCACAHTNDSFKHTCWCFNLNEQARLPQPYMIRYEFPLLWHSHWPGLEQGAGACHGPERGEARRVKITVAKQTLQIALI